MSNNLNFKELWNKQETIIPDTKELFEKANTFKRKNLYKLIMANAILVLTSAFIIFIWYYFQPEMMTTKIGIVLSVVAIALFIAVYNQTIPLLMKVDFDMNSSQYLKQLLRLKEKQSFLHKTMLNIYFILLSTGIFLYMIEYTMQMTLFWAVFAYGIIFIWIAFNWFFIRPKTIKKQQAILDELISKFESVNKQLTNN